MPDPYERDTRRIGAIIPIRGHAGYDSEGTAVRMGVGVLPADKRIIQCGLTSG
ncbi:hypothetical protein ABH935_009183 [Catenulispora sp. GAS73]